MCRNSRGGDGRHGDVPRWREIFGARTLLRRGNDSIQSPRHHPKATAGFRLVVERTAASSSSVGLSARDAKPVSFCFDGHGPAPAGARQRSVDDNSELAIGEKRHRSLMAGLYSITLFLAAALLFWVQPMIAKMLLPLMGGAPSVWNTCMVFFQGALLGGYAYAHLLSRRLTLRWQFACHFGLLALAALALPFGVSEKLVQSLSPEAKPLLWMLSALLRVVGLPFFVVASTGPLLQKWFSHAGQASSKDPYFLSSARNLASLSALLPYSFLLEPRLRLRQQD